MHINMTARRFKLSKELKEYAEAEVYRLKKYYEPIIDVDIILGWEKKDRIAEINIAVYGTTLTAHERSGDMRKSIDRAVDKLERQLKKYKEKIRGFDHEKITAEHTIINNEEASINEDQP